MEQTFIRQIVREQLHKALMDSIKQSKVVGVDKDEEIIYNFSEGRTFAHNRLQGEIDALGKYDLLDYWPINEFAEKWVFETQTIYGMTMLVEIRHKITADYKSVWYLIYSTSEGNPSVSERGIVTKEYSTGPVFGFQDFVSKANNEA